MTANLHLYITAAISSDDSHWLSATDTALDSPHGLVSVNIHQSEGADCAGGGYWASGSTRGGRNTRRSHRSRLTTTQRSNILFQELHLKEKKKIIIIINK
jgi:hypothetical protein